MRMCVAAIAGVEASSQEAAASAATPVISRIKKHPTRIVLSLAYCLLSIDRSRGVVPSLIPDFRATPGRIVTLIHRGCSASMKDSGQNDGLCGDRERLLVRTLGRLSASLFGGQLFHRFATRLRLRIVT